MKCNSKLIKKPSFLIIFTLLIIFSTSSFFAGWFLHNSKDTCKTPENSITALRLQGYDYTSPLLACDTETDLRSERTDNLKARLEAFIRSEVNLGHITSASVYVRDYDSGNSFQVNPDAKYYPASLSKIPVMIAAFKTAENNPDFLSQRFAYDDIDYNTLPEIKPSKYLQKGQSYSIEEAINIMIGASDNNAFYFLSKHIDPNLFKQTFTDLKVPLRESPSQSEDYLTAKDFSYFLRVLYNATYLDRNYSEKALEILGKSEFKDGLVAGAPKGTKIAHKFGVKTSKDGEVTNRELHDCGLVYSGKPYLICVMTKSGSTLGESENFIKDISSLTYQGLRE